MLTPDLKKLRDLIKDIPCAMLTTQEADGTLHSRPMQTEEMQEDGRLLFITNASSAKAQELETYPKVSLTYMGKHGSTCVAIAGHGHTYRDMETLQRLWKPLYKAWFPKGLEDPDVTLLEVRIDRAEYWETPGSAVVRLVGAAKALLTGQPVGNTVGEHKQIKGVGR